MYVSKFKTSLPVNTVPQLWHDQAQKSFIAHSLNQFNTKFREQPHKYVLSIFDTFLYFIFRLDLALN